MASEPGTLAAVPPSDQQTSSAFDAATDVRRTEGGGLVARLDPGWEVGGGVLNGGYLLSVAARAAVLDSPIRTRSRSRPATCAPPHPARPLSR